MLTPGGRRAPRTCCRAAPGDASRRDPCHVSRLWHHLGRRVHNRRELDRALVRHSRRTAARPTGNDLHLYGGFFELVVQAVRPLSSLDVFDNRHLVNALFVSRLASPPGVSGITSGPRRRLPVGVAGAHALLLRPRLRQPQRTSVCLAVRAGGGWPSRGNEGVSHSAARDRPDRHRHRVAAGVRVAGIASSATPPRSGSGASWLSPEAASSPRADPGAGASARCARLPHHADPGVDRDGRRLAWAQLDPLLNPGGASRGSPTTTERSASSTRERS
jgi:hypothetical protein